MRHVSFLLACALVGLGALGCDKGGDAAKPADTAAPAGGGDCTAVVAKLASVRPESGEPEKKLWTKACETMPPAMRSCIVAAKTKDEVDACGKGQKAVQ